MTRRRERQDITPEQAAAVLGRLGGLARARNLSPEEVSEISRKAGQARTKKLSAAERRRIATLAAQARWGKERKPATLIGKRQGKK